MAREAPNNHAGAEKPGRPQWQIPHQPATGEPGKHKSTHSAGHLVGYWSGHEGDEQSVASQAVYRTSSFQEIAGRRVPKGRWVVTIIVIGILGRVDIQRSISALYAPCISSITQFTAIEDISCHRSPGGGEGPVTERRGNRIRNLRIAGDETGAPELLQRMPSS